MVAAEGASSRAAAPAAANLLGASLAAMPEALAHPLEQRAARVPFQACQEQHSLPAAEHSLAVVRPPDPSADNRRAASALEPSAAARSLLRYTRGRHPAVTAPANSPGKAQRAARAQRQVAPDVLDLPQARLAHLPAEEAYNLPYSRLLPSL